MSPAPLPSDCNSVEFNLTPVCTSTRSHIGSQIVLVIQGLPGLHLVSHPVTLLSRTSRRRQPISNQLTTNSELPSMPHGDFRLLLGIEDGQMFYECFSLLPQIAYRAEATAHPPNTLSFSKALRQMEEIQFTRPFIWVCIVRFKPEFEELHSVWLSCAGDFGIKPIAFQLSGGTSAVVKVFPSLV
ncbi:hypothetical protein Pelo_13790 [Pelomyxa schiedti]|nr:hypothetical protein Pelo_13790 [Pelomyxa schiedti]